MSNIVSSCNSFPCFHCRKTAQISVFAVGLCISDLVIFYQLSASSYSYVKENRASDIFEEIQVHNRTGVGHRDILGDPLGVCNRKKV